MMLLRLCLLIITLITECVVSQNPVSPECPSPWVPESSKCYKFVSDVDSLLSWEDAMINCQKQGAELISINSEAENQFVQNWFSINDDKPGQLVGWNRFWFHSLLDYTRNPQADTGDYVVYQYDDTGNHQDQPGYFWVRGVGEIKRAYICEILKVEATEINSNARDFIFGADDVHPDRIYRGPYFVTQPQDIRFQISIDAPACTQDCPSVTFECDAKGYPQPTYQWYEGLGAEARPIVATNANHITITNGRLTIHDPSRDRDTSSYWCEASNQFGKVKSESATISYITLNEFPNNDKDVPARAYEAAVIVCDHDKQDGIRYNYRWFKNNDPTDWISPLYANHIFVSKSGSLYFSSVTSADDAAYYCTVSIEGGGTESRTSAAYNLIVDTSPSYRDIGPTIHNDFIKIIPKNPVKGDKVYLECFARFTRNHGQPPRYEWKRADGLPLPPGSVVEQSEYSRRLVIPSVTSQDEGEYTCTVSDVQSSDFQTVALRISSKPYFGEGRLDNLHLDQGGDYEWTCLANGNPPPTYSWYVNGTLLTSVNTPAGISFSDNNKVLQFQNLDKNVHPGMYQCAASNSHGTTYSSAQVRVLEFAPNFNKHPMLGQVLATEGGNTTIPCNPEGAPKPTIRWLKNGVPFNVNKDSSSPKRILPNDDLYLSGIQKNVDEAEYTCVAENTAINPETGERLSEAQAKTFLKVVQRTTLDFGPIGDDYLLGTDVMLQCRANFHNILDLVYLWFHNDKLIDFDDWKMSQTYKRGEGVSRGDLHISNITYEERGYYKCQVKTKSDQATLPARVGVYGPPGEPAGIKASNPGKHSAIVSWSEGATNGEKITSYIIEKYNVESQEWVLAKKVIDPEDVANGNTTVTGLYADTGYKFRIKAVNKYGVGVAGLESMPTQTPQQIVVQPLNATALTVYWDPIPNSKTVTGGELSGFHIQYWKDGTRQEYGRRNTVLGNVTDGTIIGLEPATDYLVTAQLFNSAGDAPPGRIIPQTTWYNAPLNMPEYVTINRTTDGTLGVNFRGVVTGPNEEPLDGYKVRIWRQGEDVRNAMDFDCGRRTWTFIDYNFEKSSFYNLRVFGYSRGGVGKMSSPLIKFSIGCNQKQTTDDTETVWKYLCSSSYCLSASYISISFILILHQILASVF
ncbi:CNTN3 [Bugula neritina]|uniref:CNTN3 n=1 Tax=Bugula neritina TaxID=10212 RepID=A0A7J7KJA2_BUGNE|nr:CNTN3 [Bugula neritina]